MSSSTEAAESAIRMPRLGHSMTEGTVVEWRAAPGAAVRAGDVVVVIETDKARYEVEAPVSGILGPPRVAPEETVAVGVVLAEVLPTREAGATPAASAADSRERAASSAGAASTPRRPSRPRGPSRARASPRARRLAAERGVDLATLCGTGPDGLVVEEDVLRAAGEEARAPDRVAKEPPAEDLFSGRRVRERRRLRPLERASGRRTAEAWTTAPHIVQMIDVDVSRLAAERRRWKQGGGPLAAVSFNDAVVKACALALAEHPELNACVDGDERVLLAEVNAGIAVDTPRGLVVPVVAHADRRPLAELAAEARRLAAKARDAGLDPGEAGTGSFTVSNLGAYGIRAGTPVLNPPEPLLVFVGAVEDRPVVRDGEIVIRTLLTLSIAYDHRVTDGAAAARLTRRIAELLEDPASVTDAS